MKPEDVKITFPERERDIDHRRFSMIEHNKTLNLVYDVIKRYASKDKPIDQSEIQRRILNGGPDNECDRKTIMRALEKLRTTYGRDTDGTWCNEDIKLHYDVVYRSSSDIYKHYWLEICKDQSFTDEELMFLMDAVQFSKHVDKDFAEEITGKLADLSNNKYSGVFEFHTKINAKDYPVRKDFFVTLGDINEAIHQQKMISFFVNRFDIDKKLHPVSDKPVEVCPYRIVVSEGNYYLLCGAKGSSAIKSHRIDRMTDVRILEERYPASISLRNATSYSNEYLQEHRYMYSGEPVKVTLEVDRQILDEVIDSFGDKITIEKPEAGSGRLTVRLKSSEKNILDWVMRFGEYVTITEPEYLRNSILDRLRFAMRSYREEDYGRDYFDIIEHASKYGRLNLRYIDLNGKDSYKNLTGIRHVELYHNSITDFSFLASYNELTDLRISRNDISDPSVISGLRELRYLALSMTGITDLEFLRGLDNLNRLAIKEYTLEDAEGLYSLPGLKSLTVNRSVAGLIDKKRLRETYGPSLEYNIDDSDRSSVLSMTKLPREENILLNMHAERLKAFSTCEVTDEAMKTRLCDEINTYSGIADRRRRRLFYLVSDNPGYSIMRRKNIDLSSFTGDGYYWYVTFEGSYSDVPSIEDLNRVYVISIFKNDHGRKLVAVAKRERSDTDRKPDNFEMYYKETDSWLAFVQNMVDNKIGWAEVSGTLERLFARAANIHEVIIPAVMKKYKVFADMEVDVDDYHYYRMNDEGKKKVRKIAYGWIELD